MTVFERSGCDQSSRPGMLYFGTGTFRIPAHSLSQRFRTLVWEVSDGLI